MKYKKEHIKPNGRKLVGGGPRDLQRQQQQIPIEVIDYSNVIKELKDEINTLSKELTERPIVGGYSGEQMDDEIRSAVTEAVNGLKDEIEQHDDREKEIATELKKKEEELAKIREEHGKEIKDLLKKHNEKLEELTTSIINRQQQEGVDIEDYEGDRPQIETVFIDPLESDAGEDLKPFLDIKDISINEKENMFDKVSKLKGILGKLPTKK